MRLRIFGKTYDKPERRLLKDMRDVLFDQNFVKRTSPNLVLYYMFRDIAKTPKDEKILKRLGLRYDITLIPPKLLGVEFVKTFGHYHPKVYGNYSYPEVYQVLKGEAFFLIQKPGRNYGEIERVISVKAREGEIVIIPPNYGHVTINPSKDKMLRLANLVARNFSSIYEPFKKLRGASYYYLTTGWVRNASYKKVPEIEFGDASEFNFFNFEGNLYDYIKKPAKLKFLKEPQKYKWRL